MTQEDKQLLLKDLCARLPYGVICYNGNTESNFKLCDVADIDSGYPSFDYGYGQLEYIKPYLRPMYSMSEEEKKEFQACHCVYGWHPDFQPTMCNLANECNMFDWLIAHHFDFRGLILKGLALEAPEDMYKEE